VANVLLKRRSLDCSNASLAAAEEGEASAAEANVSHSSTSTLPEVEVFSLLKEELPRYRLRVDYLTEFGGYGHGDWRRESLGVVETPVLQPKDHPQGISPDQVSKTRRRMKSFVYSGQLTPRAGPRVGGPKCKRKRSGSIA